MPANPPRSKRSPSIDALRGLAMVVMAIDHARDFFTTSGFNPVFSEVSKALFLTRWITHICAPIFVFLAGTGAYLSLASGKTKPSLSRFLFVRGFWLILLESTISNWAWLFNIAYRYHSFGVLWALAWSMIFLSGILFLPTRFIAVIGAALVLGHNSLDGISAESFGQFSWLWKILHSGGILYSDPNHQLRALYPLIPWIGVMALGYVFGKAWQETPNLRARMTARWGAFLLAAFVIVRGINGYGDPSPWMVQNDSIMTFFSFLNCSKYPPSLDYLFMTMGIACLLLSLFEAYPRTQRKFLLVFGRVPLFYYLCHLYLLHAGAVVLALFAYGSLNSYDLIFFPPKGYGNPLWVVYLVWIMALVLLYPLCTWFDNLKRTSKKPWLSYF